MADVKPISKFITPMFFLSWIFGVGVMEYPSGKPRPVFSFFYSAACITGYCILAAIISPDFITKTPIPDITTPVKILVFSHIILTVSIISMGWYRSKALRASIQKISFADSMMEHIGIEKNYLKMFKIELKKGILSFAFTLTVTAINSSVAFIEKLPLHTKIFTAIVISYPVFIMFIADITFMSIISSVRFRFMNLNNFLMEMSTPAEYNPHKKGISKVIGEIIVKQGPKNYTAIIKIAKHVHLQLIKVCQEVDDAYGFQILLSIIVAFAVITANLYMVYVIARDPYISRNLRYQSGLIALVWIVYYAIKISGFSQVCSDCVQESIKTGDVINELYDDPAISNEVQLEIRDFNVQLIQRPMKFIAYGFINLDFSLIGGMISSITTYFMIIIQLGQMANPSNPTHSNSS